MTRDWHEWHTAYDVPGSPLSQRLATVQQCIRDVLDTSPPGPIGVISMCAGEGRDLAGVLADHPRATDVHGRLVELDPDLAAIARDAFNARVDVLVADAGMAMAYDGAVPADLVLMCGVMGNISEADVENAIGLLPSLCAPGATVIWTRHRREPDLTPRVRELFTHAGYHEQAFVTASGSMFAVGVHRLTRAPDPYRAHMRLFTFVGYDKLDASVCAECGFSYSMPRGEVTPWLRADARAFVARLADCGDVRARPRPDVWSPMEYACHLRDVLLVQRERVDQAQAEPEPTFTPMGRDERVIELRYNAQNVDSVCSELLAAAEALAGVLDKLDDNGWARTGIYNYPEPMVRTVEWIGVHTVHELLHHRGDLTQ